MKLQHSNGFYWLQSKEIGLLQRMWQCFFTKEEV